MTTNKIQPMTAVDFAKSAILAAGYRGTFFLKEFICSDDGSVTARLALRSSWNGVSVMYFTAIISPEGFVTF